MLAPDSVAIHRRLLRRDPAALDALVDLYGARVHHLARLILGEAGGPADAEEVAADAFAAAWQRAAEFDPARGTLAGWVLMLAKYAALDRRRQLLRERYTPAGDSRVVPLSAAPDPGAPTTPEDDVVRAERRATLHRALARLPDADRELLTRRYFFEESIADLCRELGLTRSALDNRLWRARRALRLAVDKEMGVTSRGEPAL